MAHMPATSREDVRVYWGPAAAGLPVHIAIIPWVSPEDEPADADYTAAAWDGVTGFAMLEIGLGSDNAFAPGEYVVWSRITAGAKKPVRRSGLLTIGVLP